MEAVRVLERRR